MKHTLLGRATALLWAFAFVLGTAGEGFGLHPCPHHGSGVADSHAVADASHAGHDGAAAHHDHGDDAPVDSHSGPCTCGSACQAGAGAAVPVPPQPALAAATVVVQASPLATAGVAVVLRPSFFLPFAQAPPRLG